jgi:hypothetical protein
VANQNLIIQRGLSCGRNAHDNIILAAQAAQQDLESRQQRYKQRARLPRRRLLEIAIAFNRHVAAARCTSV